MHRLFAGILSISLGVASSASARHGSRHRGHHADSHPQHAAAVVVASPWAYPVGGYRGPSGYRYGNALNYGTLWPRGGYGYASPGYGYPGAFPVGGFGYVHDPYATGRFEAPDLLRDPVFQYQHKFDSQFPGRYRSGRPPLQFKSAAQW